MGCLPLARAQTSLTRVPSDSGHFPWSWQPVILHNQHHTKNSCPVGCWRLMNKTCVYSVAFCVYESVCVYCGSSATDGFIQWNVAQICLLKFIQSFYSQFKVFICYFHFLHDHIQCTNINKSMGYGENLNIVLNTNKNLKWQKWGRKLQKVYGPLSCRASTFQSK